MERITLPDGKSYIVKYNFKKDGKDCEIYVYSINPGAEKYFILRKSKNGEPVKGFCVTGDDKIKEIKELLEANPVHVAEFINRALKQIKQQHTIKKLKKLEISKFKKSLMKFYDKNYSAFIVLGKEFNEFIMEKH